MKRLTYNLHTLIVRLRVIFTQGQISLPLPMSVCCVSVRPCVNPEVLCPIACDPVKPGSPNLDQMGKASRLRSLLFGGLFREGGGFDVKFNLKSPNLTPFVRPLTHHPFKLRSLNLDQRCQIPWLRSVLFWGRLTLTSKVKFNLKIKIPLFPVSPPEQERKYITAMNA